MDFHMSTLRLSMVKKNEMPLGPEVIAWIVASLPVPLTAPAQQKPQSVKNVESAVITVEYAAQNLLPDSILSLLLNSEKH